MAQRRRSPPEKKKRDRYDRDHVVISEYSIRKAWPRKKRLANKKTRARTREALGTVADEKRQEAVPAELVATRPGRNYRKNSQSVRERVEHKLEQRRSRLGWNFFKTPYEKLRHRKAFAAFLRALLRERRGEALHHARIVRWWLAGSPVGGGRSFHPDRLAWLEAFFADEPELRVLLRRWLRTTLTGERPTGAAT